MKRKENDLPQDLQGIMFQPVNLPGETNTSTIRMFPKIGTPK